VLSALGLTGHLHTFRHAFISRSLAAGIPEAVVREWVGHVDRDVLRLYTHIVSATSQEAMRRLSDVSNTSKPGGGESDRPAATDLVPDSAHFQHKSEEKKNGPDSN
jgi:hypothetical protein